MFTRWHLAALAVACLATVAPHALEAQEKGRIFSSTCETVALWEFNGLEGLVPGDAIPTGTVVPDLTGNGLDAVVMDNDSGDIGLAAGDPLYNVPAGEELDPDFRNTAAGKRGGQHPPRISVPDDGDAFEMDEEQDFSIELYVRREEVAGTQQWGILAGTWHSRTLINDGQNPDTDGAWYGWGFIQRGGQEGWLWVCSPVQPDGTLNTLSFNEVRNDASWPIFAGSHYVVASVDRTEQMVRVYVDAQEVETVALQPGWSFITPKGYEHADFTMLTGVDDLTRGAFRTAPAGYHLDAVRIQKRALSAIEVEDNWFGLQDGKQIPLDVDESLRANLRASATRVTVDQCVRLSGAGSCAGAGATITEYAWKVGDGPFEVGGAVRELSFDAPTDGVQVSLRVTNSEGESATESVTIVVFDPSVTAVIRASVRQDFGVRPLFGNPVVLQSGAVLALNGGASSSNVDPAAVRCPLDGGEPIESSITEYRWDLDSDGSIDDTRVTFDTPPWTTPGRFTVTLTVANDAGSEGSATLDVKVVEPSQSQVFHTTKDTVVHLELSALAVGPLGGTGDIAVVPDLSPNGLDLTIVDPIGGSLEVRDGSVQFAGSRGILQVANVTAGVEAPRGEIRDDGGLFEMGPEDDFTFEIYMRGSPNITPQWGDVAGTFKARTDGANESPRYGWGIIKSHIDLPGRPGYAWFTPNQTPNEVPVFFHVTADAYNYVACVVDRKAGTSSVFVNGTLASRRTDIDPLWSFETPPGLPHAPFYLFTREQQDLEMYNGPSGTVVDALRFQSRALAEEEVAANWEDILCGRGADAPDEPVVTVFHRGDPNDDGGMQLTDAVYILNFLFLGGPPPTCMDAGDADDNGALELTDGVFLLNFLFLGGPPPPAPGPPDQPCGPDATPDRNAEGDLGCESYTRC